MGIECGCKINNCCHEIDKVVKEDSSKLNHPYPTGPEDHNRDEGPIISAMLIFIIIATIGLTVFVVNQI